MMIYEHTHLSFGKDVRHFNYQTIYQIIPRTILSSSKLLSKEVSASKTFNTKVTPKLRENSNLMALWYEHRIPN